MLHVQHRTVAYSAVTTWKKARVAQWSTLLPLAHVGIGSSTHRILYTTPICVVSQWNKWAQTRMRQQVCKYLDILYYFIFAFFCRDRHRRWIKRLQLVCLGALTTFHQTASMMMMGPFSCNQFVNFKKEKSNATNMNECDFPFESEHRLGRIAPCVRPIHIYGICEFIRRFVYSFFFLIDFEF